MELRRRVPANTNSAQYGPNYRQHARDRSFCESLEMRGWLRRISLDEFCNFPIFTYHGVFSEVEHDNGAGGCHISWRVSSSKLKGSSPLHTEERNIDRDRVRGLESRPGSLLPTHRYSEAALAGDVGILVSARLHVGKLQLSREVPIQRSGCEGQV